MRLLIVSLLLTGFIDSSFGSEPVNAAKGKPVLADSLYRNYEPDRAVDGMAGDQSRWLSANTDGPHWLIVDLGKETRIGSAHVYSGWKDQDAISNFEFQFLTGNIWKKIPGSLITNNENIALAIEFESPVNSRYIRLVIRGNGHARIKEIALWEATESGQSPPIGTQIKNPFHSLSLVLKNPVLVNQSGYNLEWPKRFTAPLAASGSVFTIQAEGDEDILFEGTVVDGMGDFTGFLPHNHGTEYVITVTDKTLGQGKSVPFRIEPKWMQKVCLEPAMRFMVDARSSVGTHPSAYGGTPWRDGTYYTFEMPSLVLLYLSNPSYYDGLPVEIDYQKTRKTVLSPDFKLVKAVHDQDSLNTARHYFTDIDPPVGENVPDLIQCIHWTTGCYLIDPETHDPSGDPLGNQIHGQTVEQFAFFLWAYPAYQQFFTPKFYRQARDFAFGQWEKAGLFETIEKAGTYKGRHCPGHSIMPNLMMYETARREGLPDAQRFLDAAIRQADWIVSGIDPADPKVTKGQRMSEHKLITGLVMLLGDYPEKAPGGLSAWLKKWADVVIARSDNAYDFRRYDENEWTLPRFTPGSHGGAGWNEPGNVAAFPGLCFAVASLHGDHQKSERLRTIGVAHFDNLFGRNPVNAHSCAKGPEHYTGVEYGWPKTFPNDHCARLELCRGTLNSSAATGHYPYNPQGPFRHPEGWTAFNASFNVGLAYTCWFDGERQPVRFVPSPVR